MTRVEIAEILQKYGGWGLSAILMLVIVVLYRDTQKLSGGAIERLIAGLQASTDALISVQTALSELRRLIETVGKATGEQGIQIAVIAERIQHGFGNTSAMMQGVVNELQNIRNRDREDRRQRDADFRGRS